MSLYVEERGEKHGATARFDFNLKRTVKEHCSTWPILFYFLHTTSVYLNEHTESSHFSADLSGSYLFITLNWDWWIKLQVIIIIIIWLLMERGGIWGLKRKGEREQGCFSVYRYFSSSQPCVVFLITARWEWRPDIWLLFLFHILSWMSFLLAHKQTKQL